MTDFAAGKFDIAMTAFDNIVANVDGQGQAPIGPQPEFVAFMASHNGFLSLVAAPSVGTVADLRGKILTVDAMTTGYAFVLYEMMRRIGLDKDRGDYEIAGAGGMAQRWAGLREGRHHAALLSAPYNLIAQQSGFVELAAAIDVIDPYLGNVAAARRSWAEQNLAAVRGYISGYGESICCLCDPSNREDAVAVLRKHLPGTSLDVINAGYSLFVDPVRGFNRTGTFNAAATGAVLDLRQRYAPAGRVLQAE